MQRLRVRFSRGEEIKFISHLDIMRLWERTLYRAGIQIAYSEGFNPHPRISLAAPLAVGVTGESELLDIYVTGTVSPHWFTACVNNQLPAGINIRGVQQIGALLPSLQSLVRMAEYLVDVDTAGGPEDIGTAIQSLLALDTLSWHHERDTGRREYDIRALIHELRLVSMTPGRCTLAMKLRCDSGGAGRPEQVALALGFPSFPESIRRIRLILGN